MSSQSNESLTESLSSDSLHSSVNSGGSDRLQPARLNGGDVQRTNTHNSIIRTYTRSILERTTTIADAIKDDGQYIDETNARKVYPSVDPNIHEADKEVEKTLERTKTNLSEIYDGRFNEQDIIDRPPDGGMWAWIADICILSINAFSWGANSSYGVFLNYYERTNHFPGANSEEYALIGGLNLGLSFSLCNVANTLVRHYHYKLIMSIGATLLVICYVTAAECKTITQLIMTQGFLLSFAYALSGGPSMLLIPTWFLEKRAIATGVATSGAGLAGIVFARPCQAIIDKTGSYKWALRMVGIVCGGMLAISIFFLRSHRDLRVARGTSVWKDIMKNFVRWDIYRQRPIVCLVFWNCIYGLGYTILLFSMSAYSTSIGLTYTQGSMVTTMQSVAQTIGRPILGLFSARVGTSTSTLLLTTLLGILCLTWWVFVESYGNMIAFGFVAGFIQGINWVNFTPMCADVVGGGDDLLAAVSALNLVGGVPMICSEIAGLRMRRPGSAKPFLWCQVFVGVSILVSVIILMPFREFKVNRIFKARKHLIERQEAISKDDQERLDRYNVLLAPTWKSFFIRMFYPVKV